MRKPGKRFRRKAPKAHSCQSSGDRKLVQETRGRSELYTLKNDIGEARNLAKTEPEMLKSMQTAYAEWDSQMIVAKWIRQDRSNAEAGGKLKSSLSNHRDSDSGL